MGKIGWVELSREQSHKHLKLLRAALRKRKFEGPYEKQLELPL